MGHGAKLALELFWLCKKWRASLRILRDRDMHSPPSHKKISFFKLVPKKYKLTDFFFFYLFTEIEEWNCNFAPIIFARRRISGEKEQLKEHEIFKDSVCSIFDNTLSSTLLFGTSVMKKINGGRMRERFENFPTIDKIKLFILVNVSSKNMKFLTCQV